MAASDISMLSRPGTYDTYWQIPEGVSFPVLANGTNYKIPFGYRYTLQSWGFDASKRELTMRIAVTDETNATTTIGTNVNAVANQAPANSTNPYAPSVRNDGGLTKATVGDTNSNSSAPLVSISIAPHGDAGASNQSNYSIALSSERVVNNGSNTNTVTNQNPVTGAPNADFGASLILGAIAAIVGLAVVYLVLTKVEEVVTSPSVTGLIFVAVAIVGLVFYREYKKSG